MSFSDVEQLFKFVGGLGMFLYGMNIMADGLQKSAGNKMKQLLGYLTNNRFMAILVGALVTAIIQSSSATTVMIVGFVNAGIISLTQAVGVIMGANIGTTITSWLVSMSDWGKALKPEFLAPLVIGVCTFLMMFSKSEKKKEAGEIGVGFGILFIGLSFMSGAILPYREAPIFVNAFRILGKNPILGIITGAVVTAIIQSSSASVGILQTLAASGLVNWSSAVYITLGQNIGTCITALLSSIGAHRTAKRAAVIHLLFNILGAAIFGIVMFVLFQIDINFANSSVNSVKISVFHTIFNVTNTILLFPFANVLVRISGFVIKERTEKEEDMIGEVKGRLDERILESPSFAVETVMHEVVHMGRFALHNAKLAIKAIRENDSQAVEEVYKNEQVINEFEKILTEYLVKIDNLSLNETQHLLIKDLLYTVSDIERVGDHSENIAELAETKIKHVIIFSEEGGKDLDLIVKEALSALENSIEAREKEIMEAVHKVYFCEDKVDDLEKELREKHIKRLSAQECTTNSGVIFLDIINNLERISDHATNIAGYVEYEIK